MLGRQFSFSISSLFLLFLMSFIIPSDNYRVLRQSNFKTGEKFNYKVKFGFIPVGEATVSVNKNLYAINNRPCYRVNVFGRTTGLTDLFHIRNTYRSYIDTLAILPQKFYMSVQENSYRNEENIVFDHINNVAASDDEDTPKKVKVPNNIQDVISGYYYLRTIDFAKMKIGDAISSKIFFDGDVYEMRVKYNGKTHIKTRFGEINVLKITPILPSNKMFSGENAIRIFVSDDTNHVPIRIEVDFSVGSANMELRQYENLQEDFKWY